MYSSSAKPGNQSEIGEVNGNSANNPERKAPEIVKYCGRKASRNYLSKRK